MIDPSVAPDRDLEMASQILHPWMKYLKHLLGTARTIEPEKYAEAARESLAEARRQLRVEELREALKKWIIHYEGWTDTELELRIEHRGVERILATRKILAETEPMP